MTKIKCCKKTSGKDSTGGRKTQRARETGKAAPMARKLGGAGRTGEAIPMAGRKGEPTPAIRDLERGGETEESAPEAIFSLSCPPC